MCAWPRSFAGQVVVVQPLGILAMIDEGETDWKLIVLRCDHPWATHVNGEDAPRRSPGGAARAALLATPV